MPTDKYCYKCSIPLHFMNKKMYCYHCKQLFCYNCLEYKKKLINDQKKTICYNCYIYTNEFKELKDIISIFNLLPITLKEYYAISRVCTTWYKIYNNYNKNVLILYNKLPYYKLNSVQTNILYLNKSYISGHNKYIIKILLSISNKEIGPIFEATVLNILRTKKTISCKSMKCIHSCHSSLTVLEIIQCLYFNIKSFKIVQFLITSLEKQHSIYTNSISNYIFIFVYILQYYQYNTNILDLLLDYYF